MTQNTKWLLAAGLLVGLALSFMAYHYMQKTALLTGFEQLDAKMAAQNQRTNLAASASLRQVENYVCRNKNQKRDMEVLAESRQLMARTQAVVDSLHALRRVVLAVTGNAPSRPLLHPAAAGAVTDAMRKNSGMSRAKKLQQQLDQYVAYVHQWVPQAAPLTLPNRIQQKMLKGNNWFERYFFDDRPAASALAALTRLEAEMLRYRTDAMSDLAERVVHTDIFFDKIGAVAVPEAEVVAPGSTYRARLMGSAYSQIQIVGVSANGQAGTVAPGGFQGTVRFAVPAWRPGQPDTVWAKWQGEIKAVSCHGDTILHVAVPYLIVKPQPHE